MPTKSSKITVPTERERIRNLSRIARGSFPQLTLGIGDDAALLRIPPGHEIAVTTDFSLEGVHFRRDWHSAQSAGHRCLARGLAISPPWAPIRSPHSSPSPFRRNSPAHGPHDFLSGLLALARRHKVPLAGGDLTRSPSTFSPTSSSSAAFHAATRCCVFPRAREIIFMSPENSAAPRPNSRISRNKNPPSAT